MWITGLRVAGDSERRKLSKQTTHLPTAQEEPIKCKERGCCSDPHGFVESQSRDPQPPDKQDSREIDQRPSIESDFRV